MKSSNIIKSVIVFVLVTFVLIFVVGVITSLAKKANAKVDDILGGGSTATTSTTSTTASSSDGSTSSSSSGVQACSHIYDDSGYCSKCGTQCAHTQSAFCDGGNTRCTTCNALTGLAVPTLSINGRVLTWTTVTDAVSYTVYIDGSSVKNTTSNTYTVPSSLTGSHLATVKAVAGSIRSAESNNVVCGTGYSANGTITNGTLSQSSPVQSGETATLTIVPSTDYILPATVTVKMGGNTLTAGTGYTYNTSTGVITVSNVTGNITVTASCVYGKYYVTASADGGIYTGAQVWISHGSSASVTFTASSDYDLPTEVQVYMPQGTLLTSGYTYDSTTGVVTVSNVTATLYISADCKLEAPVITLDDTGVSWETNYSALNYKVYKDGVFWKDVTQTVLDLSEETGNFAITVKANKCANGVDTQTSDLSNSVTWTSEYTVTLNIGPDDAVCGFITPPGALLHMQTVNCTLACRIGYELPSSLTVTMGGNALVAGTDYSYNSSTGAFVISNSLGNIVITGTCMEITVDAPVISWGDGYRNITWTAVEGADNYVVYVDAANVLEVSSTAFENNSVIDVQNYIKTAGTHNICVKAEKSAHNVLSDASNTLTGTYYKVSYTLSNITKSAANSSLIVAPGNISYDVVLTPVTGYTAPTSATITVDGVALTSSDYTIAEWDDNGAICLTIPAAKVTGNIRITASGVEPMPALSSPTISVTGDTLTITDVENATSYDIYVDGVYKANVIKSSAVKLYALSGTCNFKTSITRLSISQDINFISNGTYNYKRMFYKDNRPGLTEIELYYGETAGATTGTLVGSWNTAQSYQYTWYGTNGRTVNYGENPQFVSEGYYNWITLNTTGGNKAIYISYDLSTLNLSAGTHTITVKAKAIGYTDSAASSSASYTVASGYTVVVSFIGDSKINTSISINGETAVNVNSVTAPITYENVTTMTFSNYMQDILISNVSGGTYSGLTFTPTSNNATVLIDTLGII